MQKSAYGFIWPLAGAAGASAFKVPMRPKMRHIAKANKGLFRLCIFFFSYKNEKKIFFLCIYFSTSSGFKECSAFTDQREQWKFYTLMKIYDIQYRYHSKKYTGLPNNCTYLISKNCKNSISYVKNCPSLSFFFH